MKASGFFFILGIIGFTSLHSWAEEKLQLNLALPGAEEVVQLIDHSNRLSHAPQCGSHPLEEQFTQYQVGLFKKFCQELGNFPRSQKAPYSFTDKKQTNPCRAFWGTDQPPWDNDEDRKWAQVYATPELEPPSRSSFLAQGYQLGSPDQLARFRSQIKKIRSQVAKDCCGQDKVCLEGVNGTKIKICDSVTAQPNPDLPDPCLWVSGSFGYTTNEQEQVIYNLAHSMINSPDFLSPEALTETKELRDMWAPYADTSQPTKIVSGNIQLNSYFRNGNPNLDADTITHEFGHACIQTRAQQLAYSTTSPKTAVEELQLFSGESCKLGLREKTYTEILKNFEQAPALVACIKQLTIRSVKDKGSIAYVPNTCASQKMNEGLTNLFPLLSGGPLVPKVVPNRMCLHAPDRFHPGAAMVLECALQHSPQVRLKLDQELSCQPKREGR